MKNLETNNNLLDKNQMANNLFNSILAFQNAMKHWVNWTNYIINHKWNTYEIKLWIICWNDNIHEIKLLKDDQEYIWITSNHSNDKYSIHWMSDGIYTHLYTFDYYKNDRIIYEKNWTEFKDEKILLLTELLNTVSNPKWPIYTKIWEEFAKNLADNFNK